MASAIRERILEHLSERYVVEIETSVVALDLPSGELSILFPDVQALGSEAGGAANGGRTATLAPPRVFSVPWPSTLRVPTVRLIEVEGRRRGTSIEIMSPANKRGEGREQFARKWQWLRAAGVHLIDIDLLRRGTHSVPVPTFDGAAYLVTVTRAGESSAGGWPIGLRDRLPVMPVPLLDPDADVPLDVQAAFEHVYRVGRYHLSIDYAADAPPPPLSAEDGTWARALRDEHLARRRA